MRQVYTYRSIRDLKNHPKYNDIISYPHITATGEICNATKNYYPQITTVEDIHAIQKRLISEWENPSTAFTQFINISKVIRMLDIDKNEALIHSSFIKNKTAVLNAIRLLVEADVSPADIQPKNIEESLFKRIWEQLEVEDESYGRFRIRMEAFVENPNFFNSALITISPDLSSDVIILHGFYFITPIQERFFDMLENAGKTLIFLCCIDLSVPEVEEIWYKTLSTDNKFVTHDNWISDNDTPMFNTPFGSVFGKDPIFNTQNQISIIEYDSEIDLIRDIGRLIDEGTNIYCTDEKALNDILKEFYPDIYKRRHLLSYPVGQYIYHLHSMWSSNDECLILTIDDVQACFASGWLQIDGVNGIDHLDHLEGLKTYFSDCQTIEEWKNRLELLQETKDNVLVEFEKHIPNMPKNNQRWHKVMSDPFLNLSCFHYDGSVIQQIIDLINHLIYTAKTLFSDNSEVSISEHLNKVRKIITQNYNEDKLYEEEKAIIAELYSRLQNPEFDVDTCLPGEISEAIMLIIGGVILDEDNFEFQSGNDDSLIKPLYQVETAPISCNGNVHLCLADEERLPGKTRAYIWPLNDDMLDRLNIPTNARRKQYLQDMRFIIQNQPLASRYLFFSILQNSKVEISWISNDDGKHIASSPYIQILNKLFNVSITQYNKISWSQEMINIIEPAQSPETLTIDWNNMIIPEPKLDLIMCPWRYIYGYLLDEHPSYSSSFHYGFVLSNLIGVLSTKTNLSIDKVSEEVLNLFPYLRPIEMQQIRDYVPRKSTEDTDVLDNAIYPSSRLLPHFLRQQIVDDANKALESVLQANLFSDVDLINVGSYELCKYCPHISSCPRAKHDKREDESDE